MVWPKLSVIFQHCFICRPSDSYSNTDITLLVALSQKMIKKPFVYHLSCVSRKFLAYLRYFQGYFCKKVKIVGCSCLSECLSFPLGNVSLPENDKIQFSVGSVSFLNNVCRSRSIQQQAIRKTSISTVLWFLLFTFPFEDWCNCTFGKKQKTN